MTVGVPLLIPCFATWRFLRRLTLFASGAWGLCVGVLLAPLIRAFIFGVREICDHPGSFCRDFDETRFSIALLFIYLVLPVILGWALTKLRYARAADARATTFRAHS